LQKFEGLIGIHQIGDAWKAFMKSLPKERVKKISISVCNHQAIEKKEEIFNHFDISELIKKAETQFVQDKNRSILRLRFQNKGYHVQMSLVNKQQNISRNNSNKKDIHCATLDQDRIYLKITSFK